MHPDGCNILFHDERQGLAIPKVFRNAAFEPLAFFFSIPGKDKFSQPVDINCILQLLWENFSENCDRRIRLPGGKQAQQIDQS